MKNSLGITPQHDEYIKSSRLWGSCHTINLPNIDKPLPDGKPQTLLDTLEVNPVIKPFNHTLEQATYVEWLNSAYQTEFKPSGNCQVLPRLPHARQL